MFTEQEIKNLIIFIEIGAKALSQDKPLPQSFEIQGVALGLIQKIRPQQSEGPPDGNTKS